MVGVFAARTAESRVVSSTIKTALRADGVSEGGHARAVDWGVAAGSPLDGVGADDGEGAPLQAMTTDNRTKRFTVAPGQAKPCGDGVWRWPLGADSIRYPGWKSTRAP